MRLVVFLVRWPWEQEYPVPLALLAQPCHDLPLQWALPVAAAGLAWPQEKGQTLQRNMQVRVRLALPLARCRAQLGRSWTRKLTGKRAPQAVRPLVVHWALCCQRLALGQGGQFLEARSIERLYGSRRSFGLAGHQEMC
jgi:hypothetical protein